MNEERAGRECLTQNYSAVTQPDDFPDKENYTSISRTPPEQKSMPMRQQVDVVLGVVPEQPSDLGVPLHEDIGAQVSGERRQQHQLREELAQARAELEALRVQQSGQVDEELRRELIQVRAELEVAKGELRLTKQQNGAAGLSQWSGTSPLDTSHPSIGVKFSLAASDGEPPVPSQGLSQSELNSLSEPSPDGPDETLTCGLLPTGHPLRVCVKKLKMAPEKQNRVTLLHPGAPNSWGVPDLALSAGFGERVVATHSQIFRQLPCEKSLPQRWSCAPAEDAGKLNTSSYESVGGDVQMKPNGVSDAVARLRLMTAELRAPVKVSH